MTTFDIAVILGAACGVIMVFGGIVLLYTGAITLDKASKEDAVTLEFKKMIKVTTHYPALGLFVIGLAFIIIAVSFSKSTRDQFEVTGHIVDPAVDPDQVSVWIGVPHLFEGKTFAGGQIIASITPSTDILEVKITYPGYKGSKPLETKRSKLGKLDLGEITLTKVSDKPAVNPSNIVQADLPPLTKAGAF